jgi:hypothetical protein
VATKTVEALAADLARRMAEIERDKEQDTPRTAFYRLWNAIYDEVVEATPDFNMTAAIRAAMVKQ